MQSGRGLPAHLAKGNGSYGPSCVAPHTWKELLQCLCRSWHVAPEFLHHLLKIGKLQVTMDARPREFHLPTIPLPSELPPVASCPENSSPGRPRAGSPPEGKANSPQGQCSVPQRFPLPLPSRTSHLQGCTGQVLQCWPLLQPRVRQKEMRSWASKVEEAFFISTPC